MTWMGARMARRLAPSEPSTGAQGIENSPPPGLVSLKADAALAFILLGESGRLLHSDGGTAAKTPGGARVLSIGLRLFRSEDLLRTAEGLP